MRIFDSDGNPEINEVKVNTQKVPSHPNANLAEFNNKIVAVWKDNTET